MWHYYAVRCGKKPGIYDTWAAAKEQIDNYQGAAYGAFNSLSDAQAFMHAKSREDPRKKISAEDEAAVLIYDGSSIDGVSRSGFVIKNFGGDIIESGSCRLNNEATNEAKYHGLIAGLNAAITLGIKKMIVKGDGVVVIKQVNGNYQIKDTKLCVARQTVFGLIERFDKIEFLQVRRREVADATFMMSRAAVVAHDLNRDRS
jgi:ribonuclease HI